MKKRVFLVDVGGSMTLTGTVRVLADNAAEAQEKVENGDVGPEDVKWNLRGGDISKDLSALGATFTGKFEEVD